VLVALLLACETHGSDGGVRERSRWDLSGLLAALPSVEADRCLTLQPEPVANPFHQVVGALVLSDTSFVVANRGTNQIFLFDSGGRLVRALGGPGAGPGEYRELRWIGHLPASRGFLVFDPGNRRVDIYDASASLVGSYQLRITGVATWLQTHMQANGHLIVLAASVSRAPSGSKGYHRPPLALLEVELESQQAHTVATLPGQEQYHAPLGRGQVWTVPPMARRTLVAVGPRGIFSSDGSSAEIEVRTPDGMLLRRIDPLPMSIQVTEAEWKDSLESWMTRDAPSRDLVRLRRSLARQFVRPGTAQPYRALVVDHSGRLWIWPERDPNVWVVVGAGGRLEWVLRTPYALRITDITGSRILGLRRDAFGQVFVEVLCVQEGTWSETP